MRPVLAAVLAAVGAWVPVALVGRPDANPLAVAVVLTAYAAVAAVIGVARPGLRVGGLLELGSLTWAVGEALLALAAHEVLPVWAGVIGTALRGGGWLVLVLAVPLVFPDSPPRRAHRTLVLVTVGAFGLGSLLAPRPLDTRLEDASNPWAVLPAPVSDSLALGGLALALTTLVVAVAGLVRRFRNGDELERQRLSWFTLAFAPPVLLLPVAATPVAEPWMFAVVSLPVPLSIAVAMLQRSLYDIRLAVSRGTTFVALSVAVAGLYAIVVGGVGAMLQETGAAWLSWVGAGVVAVSFAPLHQALQLGVNRLVHGQWSAPGEAAAELARRLEDATDVPGLLETLVRDLGIGLRLDTVELLDGRDVRLAGWYARPVTADPTWDGIRLSSYGRTVGRLRWLGELPTTRRRVLNDLAAQIGGVLHAAGLLGDLRTAQERLVLAREEERRRLRRDLHDGLGPTLGALTLRVDRIRNRLPRPAAGHLDDDLLQLREDIQTAVADVRTIVEGLRPDALDVLGLGVALQQLADRCPVPVAVDVLPLPSLPAAVEVAAYRIAQEALTNVARHSGATEAAVRVGVAENGLSVCVADNGSGTVPVGGLESTGVGLVSMRERAEEIAGRLDVEGRPGCGTEVRAWLPVAVEAGR